MIDWTDRHCRYLHRLISPRARLYTEMITTGALRHGDVSRHLDFDAAEHPLALQLGGSDPADLAYAARLGERWGYDEINLNCGCPSERVQKGAFGACLMADPRLVADGLRAMQDAVGIPITVKHRLGLGRDESYGFVRDFVGTCHAAGCRTFIVHARNAWLEGLSPKENRDVPPLRYDVARQLKADFPDAVFVLNGGLTQTESMLDAVQTLDGVMIGRAAYQHPMQIAQWDLALFGEPAPSVRTNPFEVIDALEPYLQARAAAGTPPWAVIRHTLGLFQGMRGARQWRRQLSDQQFVSLHGARALRQAARAVADTGPGSTDDAQSA
jgi:tRNA-dihydrouridine synthase A